MAHGRTMEGERSIDESRFSILEDPYNHFQPHQILIYQLFFPKLKPFAQLNTDQNRSNLGNGLRLATNLKY